MLRVLSHALSRTLSPTPRLLIPRPIPVYTLTAEAATATHDVRPPRVLPRTGLPLSIYQRHLLLNTPVPNIRWASDDKKKKDKVSLKIPNPSQVYCNMVGMLKCVDLHHLKDAPPPLFWTVLSIAGTQIGIPFLELFGGYCEAMTIYQLNLAAATVFFLNGTRWGLAVSKNPVPKPDWETMTWIWVPLSITLFALSLPYPLGFLVVAFGVVSTFYLDLMSCAHAPWGNAARLLMTLSTLVGLILGLGAYVLFHQSENDKKKEQMKKDKKKAVKEEETQTDDEDKDEDKDLDKDQDKDKDKDQKKGK